MKSQPVDSSSRRSGWLVGEDGSVDGSRESRSHEFWTLIG